MLHRQLTDGMRAASISKTLQTEMALLFQSKTWFDHILIWWFIRPLESCWLPISLFKIEVKFSSRFTPIWVKSPWTFCIWKEYFWKNAEKFTKVTVTYCSLQRRTSNTKKAESSDTCRELGDALSVCWDEVDRHLQRRLNCFLFFSRVPFILQSYCTGL